MDNTEANLAPVAPAPPGTRPYHVVGRYALYGKLAAGGMATVHFGRLLGPVGFSRTVAIKRLHPQFAKDPEFVAMFLDEARVAARIQHPNVVSTIDVVAMDQELFLVMDYIRGESFSRLLRKANKVGFPLARGVLGTIMSGALHGLHAAHDANDERGQPLNVVHRDISPQNILIGVDGIARVLDFGVAKAAARHQVTRDGQMKGKLSYMSPEQVQGRGVDRRSDVFAAGVVFWEALTGRRLFQGEDASAILQKLLVDPIPSVSVYVEDVSPETETVVQRALAREPSERFQSAREFALAIEEALELGSLREVGEWVERVAGETLEQRERAVAEIESITSISEVSKVGPEGGVFFARWDDRDGAKKQPSNNDSGNNGLGGASAPPAPDEAETFVFDSETAEDAPNDSKPSLRAPAADATDVDNQGVFDHMRSRWPLKVAAFASVSLIGVVAASSYLWQPRLVPVPAVQVARPEALALPSTETSSAASRAVESVPTAKASTPETLPSAPPTAEKKPPADPTRKKAKPVSPKPAAPENEEPESLVKAAAGEARKATTAPPRREPIRPPPPRKANCQTPFVIDSRGIKRIKPECL